MSYEEESKKTLSISFPALIRFEYTTTEGRFDSKRYSQALRNYYETIDQLKVAPPKEFLTLGVEHRHELDEDDRKRLEYVVRRSQELEVEELPRFIRSLLIALHKLMEDPELKRMLERLEKGNPSADFSANVKERALRE